MTRTASNTPEHFICDTTSSSTKVKGTLSRLGLMQRTKCMCEAPIIFSSSSSCLVNLAATPWKRVSFFFAISVLVSDVDAKSACTKGERERCSSTIRSSDTGSLFLRSMLVAR